MDAKDVTAICSGIIALLALGVSVWTGIQNRRHNRLSVRPRLRIDRLTYLKSDVEVTVVNTGTGPAIIRNFSVTIDGIPIVSNDRPVAAAAARQLEIPGQFGSYTPDPSVGDSLRPGESLKLLTLLNFPDEIEKRNDVHKKLLKIKFYIVYESIYGEVFSYPLQP